MAAYRTGFADLLEPGFRTIFDDRYTELGEVFPSIFKVNSSNRMEEKDSAVTGFGYLVETNEGEQITYEDPIQMYDKTYTHKKYTLGFKVSEEMFEDDLYSVMNKKPKALALSARRTAENHAASVFNNAFSTSYTGGDAKPLCSTSHPRADGGTAQSNASDTGITLTEGNLETADLAMRAHLDDKGMKIMSKADMLLVPPALDKEARIITDSSLRSATADNDLNVYQGRFQVQTWDYLTSTTAWFLLDKNLHELNWFWRVRPEFKQGDAFDAGMAMFKVRARFSYGWSDWRGVWGSKGDSSSYSD